MSQTNINVNKQNVLQLLTSGQEIPFVIPEYQRPYSWSDDEIITLFEICGIFLLNVHTTMEQKVISLVALYHMKKMVNDKLLMGSRE